ncbi:ubiquinol-cytochrome C chaperone family protein [Sphingomonas bacterium]|uniref:ubiquinol-cytochrome C chaperone family protein n=1 Tax=Sphingomonas bacterium TaxID=1895847 RepID=UPI0026170EF9|nr:ubiquinol-cytochrome C chaperone family protein [Sphingomonas bacterium]
MGFFDRFKAKRTETTALYTAIVAKAREPHWYVAGAVPDTVDGRFDAIAAVLAMAMLRLEDDPAGIPVATHLAEAFVDDMDPQLREIGIGDLLVGKHVGRMMGMLGGRLGAYRDALAAGDLKPALVRNLYRGEVPDDVALAHSERELLALHKALAAVAVDFLVAGDLP